MAKHVNRAELIGNLGRDPEVRTTQDGRKVVTFNLATDERWTDDEGEKQTRTEWHRVVVWNEGLAEIVEKFLRKGHLVRVIGKIQTRKWQDNDGNDRYATEIVLGSWGADLTLLQGRPAEASAAAA